MGEKSLERLLGVKPDLTKILDVKKRRMMEALGIGEDEINDIETLSDLILLLKALGGDVNAKKYIDETMGRRRRSKSGG